MIQPVIQPPAAETAERAARPPVQARLERVLDGLIAQHAADPTRAAAARQQYEARRGKVHQDDELWEAWSAAFVEWLVVERVDEDGVVPIMRSLQELGRQGVAADEPGAAPESSASARGLRAEDHALATALLTSHRSLFEIRQMDRGRVELLDLLGGGEFSVVEPRALVGVEVGDVAELRLCGIEDEVYFGRTFIYHPRSARGVIVEQASAMLGRGSSRRDVIDRMASSRVTLSRYRHVPAARVYERMG
ncbi:MAG: hypothetical protein IPI49_17295 [Myxococcales bacterium]|nr:hypothetical protein [Myxococcales bacterium]